MSVPFPSRKVANEDKDNKCKSKEVTHKILMTRLLSAVVSLAYSIEL